MWPVEQDVSDLSYIRTGAGDGSDPDMGSPERYDHEEGDRVVEPGHDQQSVDHNEHDHLERPGEHASPQPERRYSPAPHLQRRRSSPAQFTPRQPLERRATISYGETQQPQLHPRDGRGSLPVDYQPRNPPRFRPYEYRRPTTPPSRHTSPLPFNVPGQQDLPPPRPLRGAIAQDDPPAALRLPQLHPTVLQHDGPLLMDGLWSHGDARRHYDRPDVDPGYFDRQDDPAEWGYPRHGLDELAGRSGQDQPVAGPSRAQPQLASPSRPPQHLAGSARPAPGAPPRPARNAGLPRPAGANAAFRGLSPSRVPQQPADNLDRDDSARAGAPQARSNEQQAPQPQLQGNDAEDDSLSSSNSRSTSYRAASSTDSAWDEAGSQASVPNDEAPNPVLRRIPGPAVPAPHGGPLHVGPPHVGAAIPRPHPFGPHLLNPAPPGPAPLGCHLIARPPPADALFANAPFSHAAPVGELYPMAHGFPKHFHWGVHGLPPIPCENPGCFRIAPDANNHVNPAHPGAHPVQPAPPATRSPSPMFAFNLPDPEEPQVPQVPQQPFHGPMYPIRHHGHALFNLADIAADVARQERAPIPVYPVQNRRRAPVPVAEREAAPGQEPVRGPVYPVQLRRRNTQAGPSRGGSPVRPPVAPQNAEAGPSRVRAPVQPPVAPQNAEAGPSRPRRNPARGRGPPDAARE